MSETTEPLLSQSVSVQIGGDEFAIARIQADAGLTFTIRTPRVDARVTMGRDTAHKLFEKLGIQLNGFTR